MSLTMMLMRTSQVENKISLLDGAFPLKLHIHFLQHTSVAVEKRRSLDFNELASGAIRIDRINR